MRVLGFTTVLFFSTTLYSNASEPLAIAVSPVLSVAPANVVIRVSIAPDAANRSLVVVTESDRYYRRSRVQLDGQEAPRMIPMELRRLPGGEYEVRATLIDGSGHPRALAHRLLVVRPPGGGESE